MKYLYFVWNAKMQRIALQCSLCYVAVMHRATPNPVSYNSCIVLGIFCTLYIDTYSIHELFIFIVLKLLFCIVRFDFTCFLKARHLKTSEELQIPLECEIKITKYIFFYFLGCNEITFIYRKL